MGSAPQFFKSVVFMLTYGISSSYPSVPLPRLPDHRLNTMCEALGIPLDHHQAGSDSRAAAFLLADYLKKGLDPAAFERQYDMQLMRTLRVRRTSV